MREFLLSCAAQFCWTFTNVQKYNILSRNSSTIFFFAKLFLYDINNFPVSSLKDQKMSIASLVG